MPQEKSVDTGRYCIIIAVRPREEGEKSMAKISAVYETVFIVNPEKTEEETAAIVEKFKALAEQHGEDVTVDVWGKRRFAYPINDFAEGCYVLINFTSPPSFPAELDRVYKITDGVMRSLIVCKDA
jgi:small subunit ribosomal protein S6